MSPAPKFDPDKLRALIQEGKNKKQIKEELKLTATTLNNHLLKLMQKDNQVYNIKGSSTRGGDPNLTKNGLKFSSARMESYGFDIEKDVKIENPEDGKLIITQKTETSEETT